MLPWILGPLPYPRFDPRRWERLWRGWPQPLKGMVKKFLSATNAKGAFSVACLGVGGSDGVGDDDIVLLCLECGTMSSSTAHMSVHRSQRHVFRDTLRTIVNGSRCTFGLTDLHCQQRLRAHLRRGTRACVSAALATCFDTFECSKKARSGAET